VPELGVEAADVPGRLAQHGRWERDEHPRERLLEVRAKADDGREHRVTLRVRQEIAALERRVPPVQVVDGGYDGARANEPWQGRDVRQRGLGLVIRVRPHR